VLVGRRDENIAAVIVDRLQGSLGLINQWVWNTTVKRWIRELDCQSNRSRGAAVGDPDPAVGRPICVDAPLS